MPPSTADWSLGARQFAEALRRGDWREALFLVSVWLKGLDGLLEVLGGCALFIVGPASILHIIQYLTQEEIVEDPRDRVANALLRVASRLSAGTEHFMALYLLIHGSIKLALVWALLRRVLVAYPLSMAVFAGFIAYQLYRYTITRGFGLLALSALDVAVIALIYLEYRALRRGRA